MSALLTPDAVTEEPAATRSRSPSVQRKIPELGNTSDVVPCARLTVEALKQLAPASGSGLLWEEKPRKSIEEWETDEWEWDNSKSAPGTLLFVSLSHDSRFMYLANSKRFQVLAHSSSDASLVGEYKLVGQGSGCESEAEKITSICPMTIFMKRTASTGAGNFLQAFLAVGYSSGYLKIFDQNGNCALSQLVHRSSIVKVTMRYCPTAAPDPPDQDEMTILFEDKRAVSIDGLSLWTALRIVTENPHLMIGFGAAREHAEEIPSLTFKKWHFSSQHQISDLMGCGPTSNTFAPALPMSQTTRAPASYTARFLAVGSRPMVAYYCTTDQVRSFSLGNVASKVTSVVSSLASTFLWRQTPPPVKEDPALAAANAPATNMPAVLTLSDPQRHVTSIIPAPPSAFSGRTSVAAITDSLGRVMVMDVDDGEILRMWKGIRDAQCGWIEVDVDYDAETNQRIYASAANQPMRGVSPSDGIPYRTMLFLVIYAPRGVIEIIHMRHGRRVGLFPVSTNLKLLTTAYGVLGGAVHGFSRSEKSRRSQCFLLEPNGEVKQIRVPVEAVTSKAVKHLRRIRSMCVDYEETKAESLLADIKSSIVGDEYGIKNQLAALGYISDSFPPTFLEELLGIIVESRHLGMDKIGDPSKIPLEDLARDDKIRLVVMHRLLLARRELANSRSDTRSAHEVSKDLENASTTERRAGMMRKLSKRGTLARRKVPESSVADLPPKEFLDMFEVFPEDTKSRAKGACVSLAPHLSDERLIKLARALVGRHVPGLDVDKWTEKVGVLVPLSSPDWHRLLVVALDKTAVPTLLANYHALLTLSKIWYEDEESIGKMLDSDASLPVTDAPTLLPPPHMLSYILRAPSRLEDGKVTTRVGHQLFFANLVSDICNQDAMAHPRSMKVIESTLSELEDCWTLSRDGVILTPLNLDSKESLSLERLVSLCSHGLTAIEGEQSLEALMQDLNRPPSTPLLRLYRALDLAVKWRDEAGEEDEQWLAAVVEMVRSIADSATRSAVVCGLWIDFVVPLLKSVTVMVDKARRVPRGRLSVRACGHSDQGVERFLSLSDELLQLIGEIEVAKLQKAVLGLFEGDLKSTWWDGPVGAMLKKLGPADISMDIVHVHRLLIKMLLQCYKHDLAGVRPLRLFVAQDTPLFVSLTQPLTAANEAALKGNDKTVMERTFGLDVHLQSNPSLEDALAFAGEFGMDADSATLLWKCHEVESGRRVDMPSQQDLKKHASRRLSSLVRSHPTPQGFTWQELLQNHMEWVLHDHWPSREEGVHVQESLRRVHRILEHVPSLHDLNSRIQPLLQ